MAFESKFDEILEAVPEGWELTRVKHNRKKYILTDASGKEHFVKIPGKTSVVAQVFKEHPINEIVKSYHTASIAPRGTGGKRKTVDGESKPKRKSKKVLRAEAKERAELIEQKEAEITEVTLKLMNMSIKRGSEMHLKLREELHKLDSELKAIDGYEDFYTRQTKITTDDLRDLQREGEKKKRAKRERKNKIITKD
jgi:hypothetical protein